jgi:hypothetical protein
MPSEYLYSVIPNFNIAGKFDGSFASVLSALEKMVSMSPLLICPCLLAVQRSHNALARGLQLTTFLSTFSPATLSSSSQIPFWLHTSPYANTHLFSVRGSAMIRATHVPMSRVSDSANRCSPSPISSLSAYSGFVRMRPDGKGGSASWYHHPRSMAV